MLLLCSSTYTVILILFKNNSLVIFILLRRLFFQVIQKTIINFGNKFGIFYDEIKINHIGLSTMLFSLFINNMLHCICNTFLIIFFNLFVVFYISNKPLQFIHLKKFFTKNQSGNNTKS